MTWIFMAILSAIFAGLTSVLAKCGIKKTDSDLATALRTVVVLVFSWIMVFIAGSYGEIANLNLKSVIFIILSGLATGASWICYFKALSLGDVNKVVPIDKSSTVLTVILAIVLFGETQSLLIKLLSTLVLGIGILLTVEKKSQNNEVKGRSYIIYALFAAIFAAVQSVLAKIGIDNVESNLATAIRTCVVLLMAWIIVFAKGKEKGLKTINKKEFLFIILSGLATGASWLCYYYAIQKGVVSVVVPIDKMSILIAVSFSYFVFGERLSKKSALGIGLMTVGTLTMAIWG